MTVAALILAGGRGTRAGGGIPKQYRVIDGVSLLRRAIDCFVDCPELTPIATRAAVGLITR